MNKREEQKQSTRLQILAAAAKEFSKRGYLKTSTKTIANAAKIAHGTLFFHFKSKEKLILELLDRHLLKITNELHESLKSKLNLRELLNEYLDYLESEENFFAIIARELPFYPDKFQSQIFFREAAIRSYFYRVLEIGIKDGHFKILDITMTLTFLFGTINYLLSNKKNICSKSSVIGLKKDLIIENFMVFIKN